MVFCGDWYRKPLTNPKEGLFRLHSVCYKRLAGINKDVSFSFLINSLLGQDRASKSCVIVFRLNWPFLCMRANQSGL